MKSIEMVSKILFITILIAVHKISCTILEIHMCENDEDVENYLDENRKGIIPILLIKNTEDNPFIDNDMRKSIDLLCDREKISLILIVPAGRCNATKNCLDSSNREYPLLFMVKEGRLLPGKKIFTSSDVFEEFYQAAVRYTLDGCRGERLLTAVGKAITTANKGAPTLESLTCQMFEPWETYPEIKIFEIHMCETDREILYYISYFTKGIVPILVIVNENSNPFNDNNMKKNIESFCIAEMLSILLVVPANKCVSTDLCLNGTKREYPSLFMLKEGRLLPENIIYTTIYSFIQLYNTAVRHDINLRDNVKFIFKLQSAILNNPNSGQSSRTPQILNSMSGSTAPPQEPLVFQTMAPMLVNPGTNRSVGQIIGQSQPSGYPVRLTTPEVNQMSTQTAVSVLGQSSYWNLLRGRNLTSISSIPPGRQDDYQQTASTRPHSLDLTLSLGGQEPEEGYPQGGTQSSAPVATYPIERELQTQDLLIGLKRPVEHQSYERSSNLKTIDFLGVNRLTSTSKKPRTSPSASPSGESSENLVTKQLFK